MTCKTISDANPDIAGIGVILAFGLQALISLLLSAADMLLASSEKKRIWKELLGSGRLQSLAATNEERSTVEDAFRLMFGFQIHDSGKKFRLAAVTGDSHPKMAPKARKVVTAIKDLTNDKRFPIREVNKIFRDEHTPETEITRVLSSVLEEDEKGHKKKQELIGGILLVASDAQTVTGIALIITAMAQQRSLSLYHLHIVYDTIDFTTVSNFAAICCSFDHRLESHRVRYLAIWVYGLLYVGFAIMFGIRLNDWNDDISGRCYSASGIASSNAKHPLADQVYLGVTSFYVLGLALNVIKVYRIPAMRVFSEMIIIWGALQFVLHVYILVALRVSNQALLDSSLEDQWGFAQILALVMLGSTLLECARSLEEYFQWKKKKAVRPRRESKIEDNQDTVIRSSTFP